MQVALIVDNQHVVISVALPAVLLALAGDQARAVAGGEEIAVDGQHGLAALGNGAAQGGGGVVVVGGHGGAQLGGVGQLHMGHHIVGFLISAGLDGHGDGRILIGPVGQIAAFLGRKALEGVQGQLKNIGLGHHGAGGGQHQQGGEHQHKQHNLKNLLHGEPP